jgi:type II secretion system protein C
MIPLLSVAQTQDEYEGIRKILNEAVASGGITEEQSDIMIQALIEHEQVETIGDVVGISIYRQGGQSVGFTVRPLKKLEYFEKLGFHRNDRVVAVNGASLDNDQTTMEMYPVLSKSTSASLKVLRNGKLQIIEVDLADIKEDEENHQ